MPYLLNVLYLALIVVASPWLLYQALRNGKYRAGFAEKLLGSKTDEAEPEPEDEELDGFQSFEAFLNQLFGLDNMDGLLN